MRSLFGSLADPKLEQRFSEAITRRDFAVVEALDFELASASSAAWDAAERLTTMLRWSRSSPRSRRSCSIVRHAWPARDALRSAILH